jgi:hypothetical protein
VWWRCYSRRLVSGGLDQQIRTQVATAYKQFATTPRVSGTLRFSIAYGNKAINAAEGKVRLSVPDQKAVAQLTTDDSSSSPGRVPTSAARPGR